MSKLFLAKQLFVSGFISIAVQSYRVRKEPPQAAFVPTPGLNHAAGGASHVHSVAPTVWPSDSEWVCPAVDRDLDPESDDCLAVAEVIPSGFGAEAMALRSESPHFSRTSIPEMGQRHQSKVKRLNKKKNQRKAMLRALTTSLMRYGRIRTSLVRAKVLRKPAEHMITLAKRGDLHARRQAMGYIYDKQLVHSLFEQVPARYVERSGGYTRVIKDGYREGDNAEMAIIELV
jgi:large subunit ribosomal protein L17